MQLLLLEQQVDAGGRDRLLRVVSVACFHLLSHYLCPQRRTGAGFRQKKDMCRHACMCYAVKKALLSFPFAEESSPNPGKAHTLSQRLFSLLS